MNKSKLASILFYTAATCDYIVALIYYIGGNENNLGTVWLCIGSAMLCLGSAYLSKANKESDDTKN